MDPPEVAVERRSVEASAASEASSIQEGLVAVDLVFEKENGRTTADARDAGLRHLHRAHHTTTATSPLHHNLPVHSQ